MHSMKDRRFTESSLRAVLPAFIAAFLLLLGSCGEAPSPPSAPLREYNVLVISLDTLRADHLGVYGYGREVSPRIDRFARASVRFETAYSHAPWTTPAHGALLTSFYPTVLGLKKFLEVGRISERVETMAEFFKSHGYRTHAVTEGGMVHADFGFDQGFEKYFQSARHVDHGVGETLKWLGSHGHEKFYFFYHTYDIHRYNPPEEYQKQFVTPGPRSLQAGESLMKQIQLYENEDFIASLEDEDLKYIIDIYDASIRWVDHHVGVLLEYLERNGLLEKTIVVITSDHGEEFLERSRTGHGYSNYEEQIRVPMVIHHPDAAPGIRKTMFRHIDLLPTLADAMGFEKRREWLGESLLDCLLHGDRGTGGKTRVSYCECGHSNLTSIQTPEWKLIYSSNPQKLSLYNLKEDPAEKKSVLEEYEGVARQFKRVLDRITQNNRKLMPIFAGEKVEMDDLPQDLLEDLKKLGYVK
jgi:arylsulfatase A-like enzyme